MEEEEGKCRQAQQEEEQEKTKEVKKMMKGDKNERECRWFVLLWF